MQWDIFMQLRPFQVGMCIDFKYHLFAYVEINLMFVIKLVVKQYWLTAYKFSKQNF